MSSQDDLFSAAAVGVCWGLLIVIAAVLWLWEVLS